MEREPWKVTRLCQDSINTQNRQEETEMKEMIMDCGFTAEEAELIIDILKEEEEK